MNLGLKTGLLSGACALALVAFGVPAYAQDDVASLRQQIEAMKERLARIEADKQEKRRVAAAAAVEAGDKPRSWKLPGTNTSMNIGGFVKFSAIYHLDGGAARSGGSNRDAVALYGLLNNDGSVNDNQFNNGHWNITARRSRFWIQTWTPTDWGELRTYIEADFAEANPGAEVLRLRHAYGTLGPVLAGQTWSTFYNVFAWPELLDDGGPSFGANPGPTRRAQIRYTHNFGGGLTADFALEAPLGPGSAALAGSATPGDQIAGGTIGGQKWPIFVAAVEWVQPTFRVRVAGMVHDIEHDNGCQTIPNIGIGIVGGTCAAGTLLQADSDTKIGWGFNGGFTWNTPIARLQVGGVGFIGKGMGNLSGHLDAVNRGGVIFTTTGAGLNQIRTVWAYGGVLWAQYGVTDTIRTTGVFGYHRQRCAEAFDTGGLAVVAGATGHAADKNACALAGAPANFSDEWYAAGNLLWNPVPQVTFGVEYLYAFSNRYAAFNARGQRIHFAAIYRF